MTLPLEAFLGPALLIQVLILQATVLDLAFCLEIPMLQLLSGSVIVTVFLKCVSNKYVFHQPVFRGCKLPWLTHTHTGNSIHPTQAVPK
jgi:hypothetical protein